MLMNDDQRVLVRYAFGHLATATMFPADPHTKDSRALADDLFERAGLTRREVLVLEEAAAWCQEARSVLEGLQELVP